MRAVWRPFQKPGGRFDKNRWFAPVGPKAIRRDLGFAEPIRKLVQVAANEPFQIRVVDKSRFARPPTFIALQNQDRYACEGNDGLGSKRNNARERPHWRRKLHRNNICAATTRECCVSEV